MSTLEMYTRCEPYVEEYWISDSPPDSVENPPNDFAIAQAGEIIEILSKVDMSKSHRFSPNVPGGGIWFRWESGDYSKSCSITVKNTGSTELVWGGRKYPYSEQNLLRFAKWTKTWIC